MEAATVQLILALLPMAESLVFKIGSQFMELNTSNVTKEELVAALDKSRSDNWPDLKFVSSNPE